MFILILCLLIVELDPGYFSVLQTIFLLGSASKKKNIRRRLQGWKKKQLVHCCLFPVCFPWTSSLLAVPVKTSAVFPHTGGSNYFHSSIGISVNNFVSS